MFKCINVLTDSEIEVDERLFVGRFFPATFSRVKTARRAVDGAFVLAQIKSEGAATFLSCGVPWIAVEV